jgi:predicted Fe-Mo cluster-binding NifX family protein
MKICLPTSGKNGLTEMVYNHFGSAPYFTIYVGLRQLKLLRMTISIIIMVLASL